MTKIFRESSGVFGMLWSARQSTASRGGVRRTIGQEHRGEQQVHDTKRRHPQAPGRAWRANLQKQLRQQTHGADRRPQQQAVVRERGRAWQQLE